ncbi:Sodium-dependent dicarboxylate transporter SdcS [Posidoniimonas polymericola]|uniref:Sodium-dependent dicarboxylate transporter SdcS n=1 Tax=Posidoniimonas polymericola TaxID=2528002 RepID=A0A5C5YID2_9BACT|nr:SLC13 family permease [Posidoniimonas polymericola]TWT74620.1 Sodium-dependent dicarboxylate transporter SdcS [Posidoniimonas polymericola]
MLAALLIAQQPALTWQGGLAILVTFLVFLGLQVRRVPVELLFLSGLAVITLAGVIPPTTALSGFSERAVILIGALFAAAAGLRTTGALDWIGQTLLGRATTERGALFRLALVAPISAVVLNTPLVAMFAPVVIDWCRKREVSPSRLLMPLSYFTILGGVVTVIGTSTTLVCNAKLGESKKAWESVPGLQAQMSDIGLLEITWVGLPVMLIGVAYVLTVGRWLLPNRLEPSTSLADRRREYLVELVAQDHCPLIGKSVEDAGLRSLPGLFLIEIARRDQVITPVTPRDVIQANDRMVFTGVVETIADLERVSGLVPAVDETYEHEPEKRTRRQLTEAVLSRTSPIIGSTVRDANFRERYNAAIVAVHRNGERLTNKIGNIRLEPGDTLLLQTRDDFVEQHRNNRDFYLVSQIGGSSARRHDRAMIAVGLFLLLIGWLMASSLLGSVTHLGPVPTGTLLASDAKPIAAIAVVLAMIVTRCLSGSQARAAIDLQVLITIAAAIGLGQGLEKSGAASWIAHGLVGWTQAAPLPPGSAPLALLVVVYVVSMLMTEAITNVAVATIMIPLAISVAVAGDLNPRPFIMAVAIAASLSFATPIGYQTNLMVMGPGGYHPRDYLRVGGPLTLLCAVVALTLIPLIWPLG